MVGSRRDAFRVPILPFSRFLGVPERSIILPYATYGQVQVTVVPGGLDVPRPDGLPTVMANVAISVSLDLKVAS